MATVTVPVIRMMTTALANLLDEIAEAAAATLGATPAGGGGDAAAGHARPGRRACSVLPSTAWTKAVHRWVHAPRPCRVEMVRYVEARRRTDPPDRALSVVLIVATLAVVSVVERLSASPVP